jgi:hypothetical protein
MLVPDVHGSWRLLDMQFGAEYAKLQYAGCKPTLIHFTMFRGRLPVALVLLLLNLVALADTPRLRLLLRSTPSAKK